VLSARGDGELGLEEAALLSDETGHHSSWRGAAVEQLVAATIALIGRGRINVAQTLWDADGIDLLFEGPNPNARRMRVQVKSIGSDTTNVAQCRRAVSLVRDATFGVHDDVWVLFVLIDVENLTFEKSWLVPAEDFAAHTRVNSRGYWRFADGVDRADQDGRRIGSRLEQLWLDPWRGSFRRSKAVARPDARLASPRGAGGRAAGCVLLVWPTGSSATSAGGRATRLAKQPRRDSGLAGDALLPVDNLGDAPVPRQRACCQLEAVVLHRELDAPGVPAQCRRRSMPAPLSSPGGLPDASSRKTKAIARLTGAAIALLSKKRRY
jgi:hypothetical protein